MNRILIVGGGVIGLLTARELALSGAKVTLLEQHSKPAQESSWAGGGIVSPLYPWRYLDSITRLASWSQAAYPTLCESLIETTGIDPELTQSGMITIAPEDQQETAAWAEKHQYHLKIIDQSEFSSLEPQAVNTPESAVYMPEVAQVRNPRLAQSLVADAKRLGVEILCNQSVKELIIENNHCYGVKTTTASYRGDSTLITSGAWTGSLLKNLNAPDVQPVRGQMLLFKTKPGVISRIVLEGNRYVIPRRDGHVLFGSTIEHTGFVKQTTEEAYKELYDIATQRFPILKQYPVVKHWAGLRPSSPAGVPFISAHPEINELFVNAGQFRNGIVLAPASTRLASDLILQRTPILEPSPYEWLAARG